MLNYSFNLCEEWFNSRCRVYSRFTICYRPFLFLTVNILHVLYPRGYSPFFVEFRLEYVVFIDAFKLFFGFDKWQRRKEWSRFLKWDTAILFKIRGVLDDIKLLMPTAIQVSGVHKYGANSRANHWTFIWQKCFRFLMSAS